MPDILRTASRRNVLRWGAAGTAALFGASACESAVDQENEGGGGGPGGELVVAQASDLIAQNGMNQSAQNATWRMQVFDTLIRLDRTTREVQPRLATEWTDSEGGRVTTLTLRDGVTWHSGRAFEAEDVKFTLEFLREAQPPFAFAWLVNMLDSIDVTDRRTVRLALTEPVNNLFDMLSLMVVFDRETTSDALSLANGIIGTGPFTFGEYQQGVSLRLNRYEDYWDAGRPRLDSILVRIMTRPEARMSALRSGQLHLATGLTPQDLRQIEGDDRFTATPYENYSGGIYLGANVNVELLSDKSVRQAIHYAIDRERIKQDVYLGQANATASPWSATSPAYNEELGNRYARDLDRAKQMLRDAGADGAEVKLQTAGATSQVAEIVEFNLREAGLRPSIQVLTAAQIDEYNRDYTYEGLYIAQHGYSALTPTNLIFSAAPYRVTDNLFNFSSPEYETLAEDALRAESEQEQRTAYDALTEFLLEEAFCCDLVQGTNTTVTLGVKQWDYSVWDELLLADATLE
ncbi:ABC transporter substrate-binding protein [Streptomyces sp. 6N223]|uniref:ABC transporter substrate-binding protein n=1 Tax=Streptomyces sp. 6N223 TaxID=3457412 RepID=UPI003FD18296